MANLNLLFQEDDCAPDAFKTFNEEFFKLKGVNFIDWKAGRTNISKDDYEMIFQDDTHVVSCDAGDPYWSVYVKDSE